MAYGFQEALTIVAEEFKIQRKTQRLNIPGLFGPPGIGKSDLGLQAAIEDTIVTFRPVNVGDNSDPTDVTGIGVPVGILNQVDANLGDVAKKDWEEAMKKQGLSMAEAESHVERIVWALNKAAAEACVSPVLLFYDDFDKAPDSVQKGLIGLFGTRQFRDYKLHPLSLMMCAGNRVGDDLLAGDLSQSILGRVTVIEMEAKFKDFQKYAKDNPGEIHQQVIGFLEANKDLLFQPIKEGEYRAPSPRGWWETSQHFFHSPEDRWTAIVERKCGAGCKNQWVAWHKILSKVNVNKILHEGVIAKPADEDEHMFQYASIFAVARHITQNKISKSWKGLDTFVNSLSGEFRIAMLVQIPPKQQSRLATIYPDAVDTLMEDLVDGKKNSASTGT